MLTIVLTMTLELQAIADSRTGLGSLWKVLLGPD